MYNEKVMEVFKNPQHMGEVENYNAIGTVGNEVCGDIMQITMRIEDNVIKDAKFKTFGCAAAVASSSTATGMIIGKTIDEALKLTNKRFIAPCLPKTQSVWQSILISKEKFPQRKTSEISKFNLTLDNPHPKGADYFYDFVFTN